MRDHRAVEQVWRADRAVRIQDLQVQFRGAGIPQRLRVDAADDRRTVGGDVMGDDLTEDRPPGRLCRGVPRIAASPGPSKYPAASRIPPPLPACISNRGSVPNGSKSGNIRPWRAAPIGLSAARTRIRQWSPAITLLPWAVMNTVVLQRISVRHLRCGPVEYVLARATMARN